MKPLKKASGWKGLAGLVIVYALLLDSCNKSADSSLSSADSQHVNSESASDSYSNDATDMGNVSVGTISNSTYTGRPGSSSASPFPGSLRLMLVHRT
jgi:hypothetical protein